MQKYVKTERIRQKGRSFYVFFNFRLHFRLFFVSLRFETVQAIIINP